MQAVVAVEDRRSLRVGLNRVVSYADGVPDIQVAVQRKKGV